MGTMRKYVRKRQFVDAMRVKRANLVEAMDFVGGASVCSKGLVVDGKLVRWGNWVVKSEGKIAIYTPTAFENLFTLASEERL